MQCAATHSDGELDWYFDSLDSDDLALPGFTVPRKSKTVDPGKCYGCGVELQTENPRTPGFVTKDQFEVKSRHRQRDSVLCSRCAAYISTDGDTAATSSTALFLVPNIPACTMPFTLNHASVWCRCQALSHGEMVPAVRDFSYHQSLLMDSPQAEAQFPPTTDANEQDPNSTYIFKGDVLITPQQLREQLKVRTL
jgi:hypothetical protein